MPESELLNLFNATFSVWHWTTTYNEQETTWNNLQRARNSLKQPTATWNNLQRPETGSNDLQQPRNDLKRPTMSNKRPETTYNDLQRATNDLQRPGTSKKRPETTYNEQETAWNNLQRTETTNNDLQQARNDLKRPTTSKTQSTMTWTYLQRAKERRETTNNKHIFRLFYNMGQTVLFSNTFSTQHLVAIIRVLLHGESWWKQRQASLYYHVHFLRFSAFAFIGQVLWWTRTSQADPGTVLHSFIIKISIRVNKGAGFQDLPQNIGSQPLIIVVKHSIIKLDVTKLLDPPQAFTC